MFTKVMYAARGVVGRLTQRPVCPCCPSSERMAVDNKGPFILYKCNSCEILYRFPGESATEMFDFYQVGYRQAGLTTDLPNEDKLAVLLESNFRGTEKDATSIIAVLQSLGMAKGDKVLDYGANWGYSVYQLRKAGFDAEGFEISKPRANFGSKLGLTLHTSLASITSKYDYVFSSHVLEHVPNPVETIREQLSLASDNGLVLGFTPNGSLPRKAVDHYGFHKNWCRVHPVLLTGDFITKNFSDVRCFTTSSRDVTALSRWNRSSSEVSELTGSELLFALCKRNV